MGLTDDVDSFLKEFKLKAKIFNEINFYPRSKNTDTLLQLEITARKREEIILALSIENYYRGPTKDTYPDRPAYYEFGTNVNNQEIYIKLSLGKYNKVPDCMSFHIADYKLEYPLRKKTNEKK
jgi:hypothetical protein